jgi:hypothetical protein
MKHESATLVGQIIKWTPARVHYFQSSPVKLARLVQGACTSIKHRAHFIDARFVDACGISRKDQSGFVLQNRVRRIPASRDSNDECAPPGAQSDGGHSHAQDARFNPIAQQTLESQHFLVEVGANASYLDRKSLVLRNSDQNVAAGGVGERRCVL